MEIRIPFLKATHEFIQDGSGQLAVLADVGHVFHVSYLEDHFIMAFPAYHHGFSRSSFRYSGLSVSAWR